MGERGRAFVLAHHSYPVLAQRFLEAIDDDDAARQRNEAQTPSPSAMRAAPATDDRYSLLRPEVWQIAAGAPARDAAPVRARLGWRDLSTLRVLEVGCGSGGNLLELLRLGFAPAHLAGIELLPERFAQARARAACGA